MTKPIVHRPRRLRKTAALRDALQETSLQLSHLIQPHFVKDGTATAKEPIPGFTDIFRWGVDALSKKIEVDKDRGVKSVLLFGETPSDQKDEGGSAAYADSGAIPEAVRKLKSRFGKDLVVFTDVCLCPSTSHGQCGLVKNGEVDNDSSLESLAKVALVHAQAGADFVAPSDMMDGRVGAIRTLLDQQGLGQVGILAYTAKYASAYYGPFREALSSAPVGGDRTTYQMDFRNVSEAIKELKLDENEGADMVMVKPALAYLDIIAKFRQKTKLPVVAYSVSGEYEMVKQLARHGMADEKKMVIENLTAIRRAGAQLVITYYASEIAEKGWFR